MKKVLKVPFKITFQIVHRIYFNRFDLDRLIRDLSISLFLVSERNILHLFRSNVQVHVHAVLSAESSTLWYSDENI